MKRFVLFTFGLLFLTSTFSQDEEETEGGSNLKIGVNVGGYFANDSSAILYSGYYNNYGIQYIFKTPNYTNQLKNYFKYAYSVYSPPQNIKYRPAMNIGIHLALENGGNAMYMDVNFAQLEVQDLFTVAVDDPNNNSPEPSYVQVPIFGHEKRLNINLGYKAQFYEQDKLGVYWPVFANVNSVKMIDNYIVIGSSKIPISHYVPNQPNVKPNGIGFGGGSGLGATYKINDKFTFDLSYNLIYTKIHYDERINKFRLNQSILFRIIWG